MTTAALAKFRNITTTFLSQQQCILCHQKSKELVCSYCRDDLDLFDLESCHYNLLERHNVLSNLEPPLYDRLLALGSYQWPISSLISQLKFSHKLINSKALADLFRWHCLRNLTRSAITDNNVIIPVPLHLSRLRSRRYNQSMEIVRHLGINKHHWGMDLCQRSIPTQSQTQLNATKRRRNVKNAFTVTGDLNKNHVIIFDDVVTTGSTVNSLCKTLLDANPNLTIEVWCIGLTLAY